MRSKGVLLEGRPRESPSGNLVVQEESPPLTVDQLKKALPLGWWQALWLWSLLGVAKPNEQTLQAAQQLHQSERAVIFFDHLYVLDALVIAIAFMRFGLVSEIQNAYIPYASFMNLGVNPQGKPDFYYTAVSSLLAKLMNSLETTGHVNFYSVVRAFEKNNPIIKQMVDDGGFDETRLFLKTLMSDFLNNPGPQLLFLSPAAGLTSKNPVLNEQIYNLALKLQSKEEVDIYLAYAYAVPWLNLIKPGLIFPILTRHRAGLYKLDDCIPQDYQLALQFLENLFSNLRAQSGYQAGRYWPNSKV